jgi:hypothetical protein
MYDEPALDKYPVMYMTSFPTDLDITFAVLSSADLLFVEPTLTILGGFYIFDFLVPMAFKGQLPFLTREIRIKKTSMHFDHSFFIFQQLCKFSMDGMKRTRMNERCRFLWQPTNY